MKNFLTIISLISLSILSFNSYANINEELYKKHEKQFREEHFRAVRDCHKRGGEFVLSTLPNGALLYECQVPDTKNEKDSTSTSNSNQ